ncbi:MAG: T9SS type A sorting domain-containing protein [Ignavibacteriae bacterium]|nr:T9SS type A sorting domain-containing protein [Ignavibacteriota bacterium]
MKHVTILLLSILCVSLFNTADAQKLTQAQSAIEQQLSAEEKASAEWALTGKGQKPLLPRHQPMEIKRGVYDPEFSGSPYTENHYFKNWFAPHEEITTELQLNAFRQNQKLADEKDVEKETFASSSKWSQTGPYGMRVLGSSPTTYFSGRVTSIDFHPTSGLHLTAGSGGMFGKPFLFFIFPLADQLPALTGGSVKVHPDDPERIFLGTGEYNRRPGTGVYRTTNGGTDWTQLPFTPTPTGVQKILVAPWNSSLIFAATDVGLFRSTNTGDSWTRVTTWDCSDVASSPLGSIMLAARNGTGVYRSTNQGQNWTQLTSGLPSSSVGRISLCIAPSNYVRAYVQFGKSDNKLLGVYRTDDITLTTPSWTNISPSANYMPGQSGIHNAITVHPTNSSIVWVGGIRLLRSSNAGGNWTEKGTDNGQVHVDIKTIYYRPGDYLLYVGCDGGIFFTDDEGDNWSSVLNQLLPITQFYNVGVSKNDDRVKYGGSQDNGIAGTSTGAPSSWVFSEGGDGVDANVDWSDATQIFATNGVYSAPNPAWLRKKTTNSGTDWNGMNSGISESTPWASIYVEQDPSLSSWLYSNAGSYFYYSTNSGSAWVRMNSSALSGNTKHTSSNSTGTFIYGCTDNLSQRLMGYQWSGGTPTWTQSNISSGLPNKEIKRVSPSMTNSSRAYALVTGVGDNQKIYRTTDRGSNWTNITGDLPDVAVNDLVENPNNSNILYLGTQTGAYKSVNGGTNWYRWSSGMPEALWLIDMEYAFSGSGDYLIAGTFGRSTFERKATGYDAIFSLSKAVIDLGKIGIGQLYTDSFYVRNLGDDPLTIASARTRNQELSVFPYDTVIIPAKESLWYYISFYSSVGRENEGRFDGQIEFVHDGDGSPTTLGVAGFVGDDYKFRSFIPESLLVKKEVKRKAATTSWCFDLANSAQTGDAAVQLHVEFKQAVVALDSYSPFQTATRVDRSGKVWEFSNGLVPFGENMSLCGQSKAKTQEIKKWWWVIYNETRDTMRDVHYSTLPTTISTGNEMPNTANLRKEIFLQAPFNRNNPMYIGTRELNWKTLKVAYVTFKTEGDLIGSLMPGRSGKTHDQTPRCFDYYDNGREMLGPISKLIPDKQRNSLFAQLIALKINIYGSMLEKTPAGFGELKYYDPESRYHGLMVKEIDSLADYFITYCDSSMVGSAAELDSVLKLLNGAFVGPFDTVSFHTGKLVLTGVKSIAEVPYLMRDPAITPVTMIPQPFNEQPESFSLEQNYPNPFNPTTTIEFSVPEYASISLSVFNILGQEIASPIIQEEYDAGTHEISFDASQLPSGIYFYRLVGETFGDADEGIEATTFSSIKKMVLMR